MKIGESGRGSTKAISSLGISNSYNLRSTALLLNLVSTAMYEPMEEYDYEPSMTYFRYAGRIPEGVSIMSKYILQMDMLSGE